jgi:hypothetical protein
MERQPQGAQFEEVPATHDRLLHQIQKNGTIMSIFLVTRIPPPGEWMIGPYPDPVVGDDGNVTLHKETLPTTCTPALVRDAYSNLPTLGTSMAAQIYSSIGRNYKYCHE